jgi:transcriptional regulator with XRE-family HTH domain
MSGGGESAALGVRLTELKQRSGLSYEQLARKTHLSRSSVHRYCNGHSVPATFAPVEAIATACRASRDDLAKLYRLWERADLGRATGIEVEPVVAEPVVSAPVAAAPRPRRVTATLALAVALAAVLLAGGSVAVPREELAPTASPALEVPMWSIAPRLIEPGFTGVTTNSNTGLMPTFEVGSVRLWNTRTRWQNLEPERGRFDWSTIERLVTGAENAGFPIVLTFGGTPSWASPNGPKSVFTDESRTTPPDNLADWDRFVRAVAVRYRGRIGAYELWDLANHKDFFSGTMRELVTMTARASKVIRQADPGATVVCPSMGELWDPAAFGKLREFAELGGFDHCDAAAVKLSARNDTDPPETMLPLALDIERMLQDTGTGIRLWSTGSAYDINSQPRLDEDRGADHVTRFFLAGLYAQYRRMYFYNWGSAKIPIVLQVPGGPETKAARYLRELNAWLTGSSIHGCGHGRGAGLPDGLWQCRFDRDGKAFVIWWTVDRGMRVPVPGGTTSVEHLDGRRTAAGADVTVTGTPVLLRTG